jgi:hypothetical protein
MFAVWHKEKEKYVGKKTRRWPRTRILVDDINEAQVYRSKGAIKNSIGRYTGSRVPGEGKKVLPDWVKIVPLCIQPKEA